MTGSCTRLHRPGLQAGLSLLRRKMNATVYATPRRSPSAFLRQLCDHFFVPQLPAEAVVLADLLPFPLSTVPSLSLTPPPAVALFQGHQPLILIPQFLQNTSESHFLTSPTLRLLLTALRILLDDHPRVPRRLIPPMASPKSTMFN